MPWISPTLKELNAACEGDLSARLLDGQPLKPASVLSVFAAVRAGGEYNLYAFFAWAFKQAFMDTAETEWLNRWAQIFGVVRKPASAASGSVAVKGLPGTGLAEDAMAKSSSGAFYRLAGVILPDGSGEVSGVSGATAVEPGLAGNLAKGAKLNLVSPVPGLSSEMVALGEGLAGGVDEEDDAAFRARLLKTLQEPPHGGNKTDYELWALEVQGVAKAVCFPTITGLGTVGVAVWGPPESPVLPQVVVDAAYAHILAKCPVTAGPGLVVYTPEILSVDFTVKVMPDTQNVRDNVVRELKDLFDRESAPGTPIPLSHFREAVSIASGEYDHELISPSASVAPDPASLPALGSVVFVQQ